MKVLFQTLTGSRLYGLSHSGSDYDYFTVVDKVKTAKAHYSTHKIVGDKDSVVVDFGTWQDGIRKGVPQYLEAAFATDPLEDLLGPFRKAVRVGTEVWPTYLKTIKSTALQDGDKERRHGLRLAYNFADLRRYGRFNPRLTPEQIYISTVIANLNDSETVYDYALKIAWNND